MKKNLLLLVFITLWRMMAFADAGNISVCSYVSYSGDDWNYPKDLGIYSFKDAARTKVFASEKFSDTNYSPTDRCATGGVYVNGHYKYVQATSGRYGSIASTAWVDLDLSTGDFQRKDITGNASNVMANIAYTEDYDAVTNTIYGYYQNSDYSTCTFGKRDVESGEVMTIASKAINERLVAVAVDGNGQLWGVDYDAYLVKIDKANGNTTRIAQVNLMGQPTGLCFDKKSGKLYMLMAQQLFEVNQSTGELTTLWALSGSYSLQGLFVAAPAAEDKAPAAVSNMTVDFGTSGSLSGTVKFTVPTTTFDGKTELTGNVSVKVSFNDDMETLSLPAGQEYTYNKTVSQAGQYSITVTAFNETGESPKTSASLFIGEDTPKAVTNLKVKKTDGKAYISWTAPAAGEHEGGFLPIDKIRYTVKRVSAKGSSTVVADNLAETSFTDSKYAPTVLSGVTYEVTPTVDGKQGASATTGKIILGPALQPAVTLIHPKATDLDLFTQICNDSNNGYWEYRDPSQDRTGIYFNGSNTEGNTDNWLISPPLYMEKGKVYRISWTACNQTTPVWYPEEMEVRIGKGATAEEQLAGSVLQERTVLKQDKEDGAFVKNFIPEETGEYNIGFHDVTPQYNGYGILMWDLKVGEGLVANVPDEPMVMSTSAHDKGELKADIVFMAPSQTNTGKELSGDYALTGIKVLNSDNQEVYRLNEVSPGGIVTALGVPAKQGDNVYTIVAENAVGTGVPVHASVFAGVGLPEIKDNPKFTVENGLAVVRWNKCADTSSDGKYVDPDKVEYTIMVPTSDKDWETVAKTKGTEYTVPKKVLDMEDGDQGLLYFAVRPSNAAGKGAMKQTNNMLAGQSYQAPWKESCAEGIPDSYWMVDDFSQFNLTTWETSSFCSDNDGGSFCFKPSISSDQSVDSCTVFFGKVNIKKLTKPALRFDTYVTPKSNAWIDVKIATNSDVEERTNIGKVDFSDMTEGGWKTITIGLDEYLDADNVMLAFAGHSPNVPLYIDNLRLTDYADKNLEVTSVSAPVKVYSGDDATVKVYVSNEGKNAVDKYDVNLYADGKLVSTQHGTDIQPDGKKELDFTLHADNNCGEKINLKAEVVCDGDELSADNVCDGVAIRVVKAELAAPTELSGKLSAGNSVELSWTAPVIETGAKDMVDSFEDLDSWSIKDFGEWTAVDVDGGYTYSLSDYDWQNAGKPQAAIVFAPAEIGVDMYMPSYDGEKYLASFGGEKECDDWIISPQLSGNAQKFSFMVSELGRDKDVSDEKFELLVSKTTADTYAFEKVGDTHVLDFAEPEWKEVSLDVEEGVKYVAIHHVTANGTALLIDNAKYQMAPLPFNYELLGYNVYCNGKLLNSTPLTETHYSAKTDTGNSVYTVKAVYTIGLSAASNSFDASTLGIDGVEENDSNLQNGNTYDLQGRRMDKVKSNGVYIRNGKKFVLK